MRIYLNSYRPLVAKRPGRNAVATYNLPPFADGSCRREPDFESHFPSISALCRGELFAPRLREGDIAVYITVKGKHLGLTQKHWRLVSILEVFKRFESHEKAASWYRSQNLPLPGNCIVPGNTPLPLNMTNRNPGSPDTASCSMAAGEDCGSGDSSCGGNSPIDKSLKAWDEAYQRRAADYGVFLVCNAQYLELHDPPIITESIMYEVFRRFPGTRNPGTITPEEFHKLKRACGV